MPKMTICYGLVVEADEWARAAGEKFGEVKAKKCSLCGAEAPPKSNFCGNCGSPLRRGLMSIEVPELVELTMRRSPPPRPLVVIGVEHKICICQALAEGQGDLVVWPRPPHPQPGIEALIRDYVPRALSAMDMRIFAVYNALLKKGN